jgi:SAM-dependent methyltransferase
MSDPTDEHGLPLWPAAERNKQPIADVLRAVLPERGLLLEVASGTGQHAAHFASALPGWTIQPSERDPELLETLARRVALVRNARLLPPLELDVTGQAPDVEPTAIYCANMVHIAPWAACVGLFRVASRLLLGGGLLVTYGPYSVRGEHTAESNVRFDQSLRDRNAEWGVRDVDALESVARDHGFTLVQTHPMPANNLILVWKRAALSQAPGR